jgi:hypothetical protein
MSSENGPSKSPQEILQDAKASWKKTVDSEKGIYSKFKDSLHTAIQSGVDSTNSMLASMETTTDKVRKPVVATLKTVESDVKWFAREVDRLYATRHEYGPYLLAGGFAVGGLLGLRRGRITAVTASTLTGFLSYLAIYEVDVSKLPDRVRERLPKFQ